MLVAYFFPKVTPATGGEFWWYHCEWGHGCFAGNGTSHVNGRCIPGILQDDPWVHGSMGPCHVAGAWHSQWDRKCARPWSESKGPWMNQAGWTPEMLWHINDIFMGMSWKIHPIYIHIISGWIIMTSLWRHWKDVFFPLWGIRLVNIYVQFSQKSCHWFSDSLEWFPLWIKNIILISRPESRHSSTEESWRFLKS